MEDDTRQEGPLPQIAFDYIKGNFFRVLHADGIHGGLTPNGNLHVAFFSERGPIPQREVHFLNENGTLGDLVIEKSVTRGAIVREVDVDVIMSVPVAEIVIEWLTKKVAEAKQSKDGQKVSGDST